MLLNHLRLVYPYNKFGLATVQQGFHIKTAPYMKFQHKPDLQVPEAEKDSMIANEMFPTERVIPVVLDTKKDLPMKDIVILPFDDVPGPKVLKYISALRNYISTIGTQLTAGVLTTGLNFGNLLQFKKPMKKNLTALFDEYGPVVRFISPIGADIVLINHPDHIQKVYALEGEYPVRSTLDSLEKYRSENRNQTYGLYTVRGPAWRCQRSMVMAPLHNSVTHNLAGIKEICGNFTRKIYNTRNYQDELSKDLYREVHKWAFDCMGLILFSKKFTMIDTELVYSQCDMSWLYHCLDKATEVIINCESGMHLWKLFPTPSWLALVKYCDALDSLIGKYVMENEQLLPAKGQDMELDIHKNMIQEMLMGEGKMNAEDIATIMMDMLLIGVNTITSTMSFLLYYLAKYQKSQKKVYKEISKLNMDLRAKDFNKLMDETPYLQACIKETLRLVPPIPILTRILPKNIILDRYNIPRGTLIIMSTQDASLKEGNYEDASVFCPDRWLRDDAKEYHAFASIPFGSGLRKCLGQNIAEKMLCMLTIDIIQKFKLEYHYGDIQSTKSFIARPNKPLKIRFVDRV